MKKLFLFGLLIFTAHLNAQSKYFTSNGSIIFESSVPSFEEVKAKNNKVSAVLKSDGSFASLALIKGFRFKIALMEEHFNENYMDSETYPKSTFSGKIESFSVDKLTSSFQEFVLSGQLKIRDKSEKIQTKCFVKKEDELIIVKTNFSTKPETYGVKIPNIVRKKIAESVQVEVLFELKEK